MRMPATSMLSVITSYSIHYTKLYDRFPGIAPLVFSEAMGAILHNPFVIRAKTAAGVVLFLFVATHLMNHAAGLFGDEALDEGQLLRVITSYSIHYTKLYEFWRTVSEENSAPS